MNQLAQFLDYAKKVFDLPGLLRRIGDGRCDPQIPGRAVLITLVMGVILRLDSYLKISRRSQRPRWQRLMSWHGSISDDTLEYFTERASTEDLRRSLVQINQIL